MCQVVRNASIRSDPDQLIARRFLFDVAGAFLEEKGGGIIQVERQDPVATAPGSVTAVDLTPRFRERRAARPKRPRRSKRCPSALLPGIPP
jgi:hypothetical protein